MAILTLQDFRDTLLVIPVAGEGRDETIYTYWNNRNIELCDALNLEEVLHVVKRADGSFYLQIANLIYEGKLEDLEEKLYQWAIDEEWLN
jgi:hypothetical protein